MKPFPYTFSVFLFFLLSCVAAVSEAATFTCNATTTATCQSMIGYVSTNASTYGNISSLFQVPVSSILSANNLSITTPNTTNVLAGSTVRIPVPCRCTEGTGQSDHIPVYTVQYGDGMDSIARYKFDLFINYTEIAYANNISDPNEIQVGLKLWIPLPCNCDPVEGKQVVHLAYQVESGNTAEGIATMFGTTESTLLKLNGISDPKSLKAEQILDVPLQGRMADQAYMVIITKKNRTDLVVVGAAMLGASLLIVIITAITGSLYLLRGKRGHESKQADLSPIGMNMKVFSYKELHDATIGFAEELGRGAFGIVYKGILKMGDHSVPVAVKKLDRLLKDGDREFTNEVQSIGQIHHKNVIKLIGFCNEGPYKMLVYEYMSNGSIANVIFGTRKLNWNRRAQIAVRVARGLCYLHEGCSSQIIHCDIKPTNILLDDNLIPRISDFGLAKLMGVDQTRATTSNIRGTKGYFAPEWFKNTGITPKMDVYSFGVMLMEIVCSRRNIEHVEEEEIILTYWAYDCFTDGRVDLLVQGDKEAEADMDRVEIFLRVAIWCIQENPTMRPTMHKVVLMLEGEVPVAPLPDLSSHM